MRIIRHVPTEAALHAAGNATDFTDPHGETEFYDWANDHPSIPGIETTSLRLGGAILDATSFPIDVVEDLLATVPVTPAGTAWTAAMRASATLTAHDAVRPHDDAVYDTPEELAARDDLLAYATTLRQTTPLLDPIADTLITQAMGTGTFNLGDLQDVRNHITNDGITLTPADTRDRYDDDGWCHKHQEHCHPTLHLRTATWAHLETLHPGIRTDITALLARLDANLPAIADMDNGTARMPRLSRTVTA